MLSVELLPKVMTNHLRLQVASGFPQLLKIYVITTRAVMLEQGVNCKQPGNTP